MLTEMKGKAGRICGPAQEGRLHCPLIVRPTSEDVVTANIVRSLRLLNPRWWLPDLLNDALGVERFRRQVFRRLRIEPWENRPCFPPGFLPWPEGSTQVDVTIRWENPPTTVYIEMKYGSGLSSRVSSDDGTHGYPSDQLVRNARVGLMECGYFRQYRELFPPSRRDFVVLVVAPTIGHPLVERYREPERLRGAIPHSDRIAWLPRAPFVGELSYGDIICSLRRQCKWFNRLERIIAEDLTDYLTFKLSTLPKRSSVIDRAIKPKPGTQTRLRIGP